MKTPSVAPQRDLALLLLLHEAVGGKSPAELAAALETACQKLSKQISPLFGAGGFHAVIARAIHLAAEDFPFLESVKVKVQPGICLEGLGEVIEGQDVARANSALAAVLVCFIDLLCSLIGEELTLRQFTRAWPEVPMSSDSICPEEEH
ncbi:MAG: hypothetical protein Q7R39_18925 [Dehalococcoidia bacterium]|nr:hypothetical protein [Dehalococcoidia bacterium]